VSTSRPGSGAFGEEIDRLLASFTTLLPGEDAATSVLGAPFEMQTLSATSRRAATLDETQIDLGEGPAWSAYRAYRPVELQVDDERHFAAWPVFALSAEAAGTRTVLAVPLVIGTSSIGAVTLYSSTSMRLDAEQLQLAGRLSGALARAVVDQAITLPENGRLARDPALSRRDVHQATGMVIGQTRSTPADALAIIRAYAFAEGVGVRDVAARILAGSLDFSHDPPE
jgi:hypothetical protein